MYVAIQAVLSLYASGRTTGELIWLSHCMLISKRVWSAMNEPNKQICH
jgi:hypothetical protein